MGSRARLAGVLAATVVLAPGARRALPPFSFAVAGVDAAQLGRSWHPGCPVGPAALRQVRLAYVGFDGVVHHGTMVVNRAVVAGVVRIFSHLYEARFPIRSIVPVSAYGASDAASTAADNTSSFNCRLAVASGPPHWSVHAFGEAIDVNPVENPYLLGGTVDPPAGRAYLDRADVRPGMAVPGGTLVRAFTGAGWYWGGRWSAAPDYQHFSLTGG